MPTPSTPLAWRRLAVPKRGHRPDEYEDAAVGDGRRGRFAIADGATESAFAGHWALLLVEAFVRDSINSVSWSEWIPAIRQRWTEAVGKQELPWYLQDKFEQGAFSTLLGVEFSTENGTDWHWKAVAVGDCCMFHVRQNQMVCSFPIESAVEFNTSPELLCSRPAPPPRDQRARGRARPGDRFLLASDALAAWALREQEQQRPPWPTLLDIVHSAAPEQQFREWVESHWQRGTMKVDDMTLLAVELPAAGDAA